MLRFHFPPGIRALARWDTGPSHPRRVKERKKEKKKTRNKREGEKDRDSKKERKNGGERTFALTVMRGDLAPSSARV